MSSNCENDKNKKEKNKPEQQKPRDWVYEEIIRPAQERLKETDPVAYQIIQNVKYSLERESRSMF